MPAPARRRRDVRAQAVAAEVALTPPVVVHTLRRAPYDTRLAPLAPVVQDSGHAAARRGGRRAPSEGLADVVGPAVVDHRFGLVRPAPRHGVEVVGVRRGPIRHCRGRGR